jgi:hypothetical protein
MKEERQRRADHEDNASVEGESERRVVLHPNGALLELVDESWLAREDVGDEARTERMGDDADFAAERRIALAKELVDSVCLALLERKSVS